MNLDPDGSSDPAPTLQTKWMRIRPNLMETLIILFVSNFLVYVYVCLLLSVYLYPCLSICLHISHFVKNSKSFLITVMKVNDNCVTFIGPSRIFPLSCFQYRALP